MSELPELGESKGGLVADWEFVWENRQGLHWVHINRRLRRKGVRDWAKACAAGRKGGVKVSKNGGRCPVEGGRRGPLGRGGLGGTRADLRREGIVA